MATIPLQDWFLTKPEAEAFLNKVAREIRWLATEDKFIERFVPLLEPKYVETNDVTRDCHGEYHLSERSFFFRFELDRGRPHKGHTYRVRSPGIIERSGSKLESIVLNIPSVSEITGEHLLDAIREFCVMEVMVE